MKKAAFILTIVGMVLTAITLVANIINSLELVGAGVMIVMYVSMIIADIIVGIFVLKSLHDNNRKVALGVLAIIFVSPLSGIFYLCWKPEETHYVSNFAVDFSHYDSLSNEEKKDYLNKLWFQGKITQARYQELLNELEDEEN